MYFSLLTSTYPAEREPLATGDSFINGPVHSVYIAELSYPLIAATTVHRSHHQLLSPLC